MISINKRIQLIELYCSYEYNDLYYKLKQARDKAINITFCVISDAMCYEDCKINDDDLENLENFRLLFDYEDIKDLINAYRWCKNAYNYINKMFTKEEKDMLMKYFEEKGLL